MEIDVREYLSEDEIKQICIEEIRHKVNRQFQEKDLERVISNSAYYKVFGIVDDMLPGDYAERIVKNVEEIIDNSTDFALFRWHYDTKNPESVGAKIIDEAVRDNKQKIIDALNDYLDKQLNEKKGKLYEDFIEMIQDRMWDGFNIKFEK
jgi:hypothetical protein